MYNEKPQTSFFVLQTHFTQRVCNAIRFYSFSRSLGARSHKCFDSAQFCDSSAPLAGQTTIVWVYVCTHPVARLECFQRIGVQATARDVYSVNRRILSLSLLPLTNTKPLKGPLLLCANSSEVNYHIFMLVSQKECTKLSFFYEQCFYSRAVLTNISKNEKRQVGSLYYN